MTLSRVRVMVCLFVAMVTQLFPLDATGQQRPPQTRSLSTSSPQPNQQQRTTQQSRPQQQRRTAQQPQRPTTAQNRNPRTQRQQPMRQAQRNMPRQQRPGAKSTPQTTSVANAQPKVIEKADAETKAAFLKLVGANWIWSPAYVKDDVPTGDCYFRKTFSLKQAEFGQVHVACDNQYELYVNGRLAGQGNDWRKMNVHDVAKLLLPGLNVVAIKATNTDAGAAGLAARVVVKERGGTFESFSTDSTWRTSVKPMVDWTQPRVRDSEWLQARVYGQLGAVLPWGDEVVIADEGSRFLHDPEFSIERLVTNEQAGSLIAMAFNANGDILASQEGGPLMLIRDADRDGKFESVAPYCQEVRNVQGILPLGNRVYAIGDGPAGGALYQMVDQNGDHQSDELKPLVRFRGAIGEHGPHTVRLGPDGLLYLLSGNFSQADTAIDARSPYLASYEGDLVQPRQEDPQGYAVGVPSPGGTILRTDVNGSFVELVAGGFRNPYDFAFDADGELFTSDADMEWDIGAPWYRPTRVCHVPPGGEFGWRSGWAKWPEHYLDSLPAAVDTGPGSPTGLVYYDHKAFPTRLQNTLFVADWAMGQIHAIKLERRGASYKATMSPFIKGRPLNVTGLDVGPDGALYFCTGGRGTDGGVYRVRWNLAPPSQSILFGNNIDQVLQQPQLQSDWSRKQIASAKRKLGDRWQSELERVAENRKGSAKDRLRALDLLTYFGPTPSPELLTRLANDPQPAMRVRVARLMGNQSNPMFSAPLGAMLADSDPWVRRVACEALAHRGEGSTDAFIRLLGDSDRFVAFAARRALEKKPAAEWQDKVLNAAAPRPFLQGATGLLLIQPTPEMATRILARCEAMMRGDVQEPGQKRGDLSDPTFLDLLRVIQLSLIRGPIAAAEAPTLTQQILREYPTRNVAMNRELVKLLAYLQPPGAAHALAKQIETNIPDVEKLQIAAFAPRIQGGWETPDKLIMLTYYEKIRGIDGGHSVNAYIENFARDFFTNLNNDERLQLISSGERFPTSALSVLAKLEKPTPELLASIRALDERLHGKTGEPVLRLRVGIVAVLGASGEPKSLEYLRSIYYNDPQRRAPVAMSLTQQPHGENWLILVDSLRTVEGEPARTILKALAGVDRRPETSEPFRNTILLGLRLQQAGGGELAVRLLEKWMGQTPYHPDATLPEQLTAWQTWYANTFPEELPAELPKESRPNKWSYEELISYLDSDDGRAGSPSRGHQVFQTAQCATCHRFNGQGESIGPDLTTVAQRFQRKEILESIMHPNQVVSDQYASKIIIAGGRTYMGMASQNADGGMTVLQTDGQKVELAAEDIEDVRISKTSSMPEGLLNNLTLQQVSDLFAFLMRAPEPNVATKGRVVR